MSYDTITCNNWDALSKLIYRVEYLANSKHILNMMFSFAKKI